MDYNMNVKITTCSEKRLTKTNTYCTVFIYIISGKCNLTHNDRKQVRAVGKWEEGRKRRHKQRLWAHA